MFGVGLEEFIAIIMVALIVLGPERLPIAMRHVGRWVRKLRDMSREFRREFAEEFAFIQEEMSELRKEADATRSELAEIRRELGQTVQETTDEVTSIRDDVVSDVQGAVDAVSGRDSASTPALPPPATTATNGAPSANGEQQSARMPSFAPNPADAMALAISETFSANGIAASENGAVDAAKAPEPASASDQPSARLEAFAPDVGEPERPPDLHPAAPVLPPPREALPEPPAPPAPAEAVATPEAAPSVGIGKIPEPGLRNQLGGFMRLIIMKALETDSAFREQAEEALRAQARADAVAAAEGDEAPDVLELVAAWVRQRRQLVGSEHITVRQKAPESAIVELFECPYGLTSGDAHPVCDVSNVYDAAFFEQFDMTAMYATRMSDGAAHCKLMVVTNERLKAVEQGEAESGAEGEAAEAEELAPPAS
ncbi:MAG: Sec-independent protein translocase protein TatB [Chloroflexi bacterium]|nr:Sec-independent protein translocase protein TatB [Chloroflexota bacterium]